MKIHFKLSTLLIPAFSVFCLLSSNSSSAQTPTDTIKVMAYNTLGFSYSNGCQGSIPPLYADLKTIVQFAKPDVLGLDKMVCVQTSPTDNNGISPYYFPDTIIAECLNSNYSFCPFTDMSNCAGSTSLIFYNTAKIGYVSTTPLYYVAEDIDLFKLYYKDPALSSTKDTTFLYVVLCHTISGSTSSGRDQQDSIIINKIKILFPQAAPNLIYMGDFNTRSSSEPGYEYITQTDNNAAFQLNDPPFHPDAKLSYPLNWNSNPTACSAEMTTTTRETTLPNACGTTGGAKDWYDHIFLSPWIVNNTNYISYIKNSYTTIGNDGNRNGVSINTGTNISAPANVINALFNFSDKYPVMVSLAATSHVLGINNILEEPESIRVNNPIVNNDIVLHFATFMNGENVTMNVYDVCGRDLYKSSFVVNGSLLNKNILLAPGVYMLHFTSGGYSTTLKVVKQ